MIMTEEKRLAWWEKTKERIRSVKIAKYKLAAACHISRVTLQNWYKGVAVPTAVGLYALNKALEDLEVEERYRDLARKKIESRTIKK